MVTFWNWFVRFPAFTFATVGLATGILGIAEWPLALGATALGVVVGDCAWHLAGKAKIRQARRDAEREAARIHAAVRERAAEYGRRERAA